MKLSTKLLTIGALILGIVLVGCTSLPLPTADNQTLVIGTVTFTAKGFEKFSTVNINGTHLSGIILSVKNIETDVISKLYSDENGFICSNTLAEGSYIIEELTYNKKNRSAWVTLPVKFNGTDILNFFTIQKDVINNLGEITCTADGETGKRYYSLNNNYDKVISILKELDEENDWANVPISNVTFNLPASTAAEPSEN